MDDLGVITGSGERDANHFEFGDLIRKFALPPQALGLGDDRLRRGDRHRLLFFGGLF
jgi:hypothetical protein